MRSAAALPRDQLVGMGVTFGKFTKSKKFRLHVTCLDYIAQLAPYKAGGSPRRVASGSRPLRPWASRAARGRPPRAHPPPARHLPRARPSPAARAGVGQAVGGAVVFVREPRAQGGAGSHHRGHAAEPGCPSWPSRPRGGASTTCPRFAPAGVVVLSMADVPLGFGVTAKSTAECRKLDPQAIVALHQADVGEYLRDEGALTG